MGIRIRDHFNVEELTFKDLDFFKEVVREIVNSSMIKSEKHSSLFLKKAQREKKLNDFSGEDNIKINNSEFFTGKKSTIKNENSDYSLAA